MMKFRFGLALICLLLSPVAMACSCLPPASVEQQKAQSTRVFHGRVVSVEERTTEMQRGWLQRVGGWFGRLLRTEPAAQGYPYRRVSFEVVETFKGPHLSRLVLSTGIGGGDCGYPFEVAQDYVVYAHGTAQALEAGICSLTGPASDPGSGLEQLRGR